VGYGSGALATIDPASATVEHGRVDVEDLRTALARLPDVQREAVLLVGASGFSYEEAAQIMCVAVVTVKSRVNRARVSLAAMLSVDDAEEVGPDAFTRAAMQIAA
jgi:RNA polymerase sigma-70 factor (ECF subfamily)